MKLFPLLCLCALLTHFTALAEPATNRPPARKIAALLIDGQNNHDWKSTTPLLKMALESSGLFTVTVATTPPLDREHMQAAMVDFSPAFTNYGVVVLNYNGQDWPAATRANFESYITNGGGMVSVHAADNSFPAWRAYNLMIGVGGWNGRNAKSGEMLRWRENAVQRDRNSFGGTHGRRFEFLVETRDSTHPIMAGLPSAWLHAHDELYATLVGPAENVTVLATAKSDVTGENEPMLMTITYGAGRIFHTTLGHDPAAMMDVGFVTTLIRGTEWAATGKVTHPVPKDFPGTNAVSVWKVSAAK